MDSESGHSLSIFFVIISIALFAATGLVVDGGTFASAKRQAQLAAQSAAITGTNSLATQRLSGSENIFVIEDEVRRQLQAAGYSQADIKISSANTVSVEIRVLAPTTFLSVIGINSLSGSVYAESKLFKE